MFIILIKFICYLIAFILSSKTITVGKLVALAGATKYSIKYFISILFLERYGKKNSLIMYVYTIFALIVTGTLMLILTLIITAQK